MKILIPAPLLFAVFCSLSLTGTLHSAEKPLFDAADVSAEKSIELHDATAGKFDGACKIETHHREPWPGATFKAPRDHWDLTDFSYVAVDLKNLGSRSIVVALPSG